MMGDYICTNPECPGGHANIDENCLDNATPTVNPCCVCGLPIVKAMTEPDRWSCNNAIDCIKRMLKTMKDPNIRGSYKTKLRADPFYLWTFKFNVECQNQNGDTCCTDYVHLTGLWRHDSFDLIIADALEIAREYDLPTVVITNESGDELYRG